jgi:ArsR family transcriptional regulator
MVTQEQLFKILRALSEPKRVEILKRVESCTDKAGVACSCVLEGMGISQSTFSHHVGELVDASLLNKRDEGRFAYLSVNREIWNEFLESLKETLP